MGTARGRWPEAATHRGNLVLWRWWIECAHDRGRVSVGSGSAEGLRECDDPAIGKDSRAAEAKSAGVAGVCAAGGKDNRPCSDGLHATDGARGDGGAAGPGREFDGAADR